MIEMLTGLADPALAEAIDANFAEEVACKTRVLPQAELRDDGEVLSFYTGYAGFNGVLRARFASFEPAYLERRIEETLAYFHTRGVHMGWTCNPGTRPANLGDYLEASGLKLRSRDSIMVADLQALSEDFPPTAGLEIREALQNEELRTWFKINAQGFRLSSGYARLYFETHSLLGSGPGHPWRFYIGYLNGIPAGIASQLLHAGIAGIYGVTTLPQARRRGIATALTLHALRQARSLGYRVALLAPTEMALGIYRRIGFQEYCKTAFYRWLPE